MEHPAGRIPPRLGRGRVAAFAVAALLVLVTLGMAAWACGQVPAGATIPIHWDAAGRPNGFAGRWALFLVPGLATAVTLLFAAMPAIEPRRAHFAASAALYYAVLVGIDAIMVVVQYATVTAALGARGLAVNQLVSVAVGLLFAVIGVFLPRVRSNFLMGIRTPWTLTSELAWSRTHRVGGVLLVVFGFAVAAAGLAAPGYLAVVLLGGIVVLVAVVTVYSYVVWRHDPGRQAFGS